ncbi:MAG TPA: HAD family hydrolase [Solirubrobacteraceae bacterium]|nr:HAD family hydrolase [Solirubrobacteraceae bacterium]
MTAEIKAIVFDMDGVLIDARDWHYEALNRALALLGYEITRYEHLTTYDGLPTGRKLQMLTVERGLPAELHGFLNSLKQQYTLELVATRCRPVFHHQYALARLKAAGYQLGVASNSVRRTVEEMMERSDLMRYLDLIISNEDVARAKPDPEMYLTAMDRFGVSPGEMLIVEDNENGVQAATAAGGNVMVVAGPDDVTLEAVEARIELAVAKRRAAA